MRILVVTTSGAWPLYPGHRIRTALLLQSLVKGHDVDVLFVMPADAGTDVPLPPDVHPRDAVVIPVPRLNAVHALARWPFSRWPWMLMKVQWGAALDQVEARLRDERYDLLWGTDSSVWPSIPKASTTPIVLDIGDLQDRKLELRQEARRRYGSLSRRDRFFAVLDRFDLERFRRLQAEVVDTASVVTVCSHDDATRLGSPKVAVVPNGYRRPEPIDRRRDGNPPSLLYLGDLTYRPNVEAADLLVKQVLPLIRVAVPGARVRLVGNYGSDVARLGNEAGVDLVGHVPDVAPELALADISVVPMVSGSGTRIKILEAFAYGVPVVSTAVGAEGIDADDGVHLLIADTPETLAKACVRLLSDPDEARELAARAQQRYEALYTPEAIERAIDQAIQQVLRRPG